MPFTSSNETTEAVVADVGDGGGGGGKWLTFKSKVDGCVCDGMDDFFDGGDFAPPSAGKSLDVKFGALFLLLLLILRAKSLAAVYRDDDAV